MTNLLKLTDDQQRAYDRFIRARNKMGIGRGVRSQSVSNPKPKWIPQSDYVACVDVTGLNHPMFVVNDEYLEYKEAFQEWLKVEPQFRFNERMRASRGDYGASDNWEERKTKMKDSVEKLEE